MVKRTRLTVTFLCTLPVSLQFRPHYIPEAAKITQQPKGFTVLRERNHGTRWKLGDISWSHATSRVMAASNLDLTNRITNEKALCFSSTYCTVNAVGSRVCRSTFLRNVGGNILHSATAHKTASLGVHIYKGCQDHK